MKFGQLGGKRRDRFSAIAASLVVAGAVGFIAVLAIILLGVETFLERLIHSSIREEGG